MTHDGNFNNNNLNTVRIPNVLQGVNGIFRFNSGNPNAAIQYYTTSDMLYTVSYDTISRSRLTSIQDFDTPSYAKIGGQSLYFTGIYPTALNGYFYNFSVVNDLGGATAGANIWRAPVSNPLAWSNTGFSTANTTSNQAIFSNGTNLYLIGGCTSPSNSVSTIEVANAASPLSFANAGNLPAARDSGMLTVVGSTLYYYGGNNNGTQVTTIYSAPVSNPTSWTSVGNLPVGLARSCVYNDGTYIYLIGGTSGGVAITTIYRASVSTPTVFTSFSNIPAAPGFLQSVVNNGFIYLIGAYRAPITDLTNWTSLNPGLSTAVRNSHVLTDVNTNKVYMFGGITTGTTAITTVQSASITNPVEWTNESYVLPAALAGGELIRTKSQYYIVGGTNGNVYATPSNSVLNWALSGSSGVNRTRGRAVFVGDHLFYCGGETAVGTPVSTISRVTVDNSTNGNGTLGGIWQGQSTGTFNMAMPLALSRFALVKSDAYIYLIGGYTTGGTINTNIYRCHETRMANFGASAWVVVGTLTNPTVDPTVSVLNNYVYIIGGGPEAVNFNTVSTYVSYASMTDLANGIANFTEENTATISNAESSATIINDSVYFFGGRSTTNGTNSIFKTSTHSIHNLISPKVPETFASIPSVSRNGSIGTYTSYQRSGMLPWLMNSVGT